MTRLSKLLSLLLGLPVLLQAQPNKYVCGQNKPVRRPYGKVEQRVDCESVKGRMWVWEYKGAALHGLSQEFDPVSGRKLDSCFYRNDEKHGTCLAWDSLGNVVGRSTYRNGKPVGKRESYYAVGRPGIIKQFNSKGEEEGPWEEWWPNGKKKAEFLAKEGRIISGTEYYPDGTPRLRFISKHEPQRKSIFKKKRIQGETWAPTGRSTGRIIDGNGEWTHFSASPDSTTGKYNVFREVYKDSLMIDFEELDSAEVAQWLK